MTMAGGGSRLPMQPSQGLHRLVQALAGQQPAQDQGQPRVGSGSIEGGHKLGVRHAAGDEEKTAARGGCSSLQVLVRHDGAGVPWAEALVAMSSAASSMMGVHFMGMARTAPMPARGCGPAAAGRNSGHPGWKDRCPAPGTGRRHAVVAGEVGRMVAELRGQSEALRHQLAVDTDTLGGDVDKVAGQCLQALDQQRAVGEGGLEALGLEHDQIAARRGWLPAVDQHRAHVGQAAHGLRIDAEPIAGGGIASRQEQGRAHEAEPRHLAPVRGLWRVFGPRPGQLMAGCRVVLSAPRSPPGPRRGRWPEAAVAGAGSGAPPVAGAGGSAGRCAGSGRTNSAVGAASTAMPLSTR